MSKDYFASHVIFFKLLINVLSDNFAELTVIRSFRLAIVFERVERVKMQNDLLKENENNRNEKDLRDTGRFNAN